MRTRSSVAALALVALLSTARPAHAHDAASPLAVAVEVERTRLAVVVRYTVERGEAARALREQFDRDADGGLDAGERAALRDFLAERARAALTLSFAGAPLELEVRSVDADLEGDARVDARVAVVLRLVAKLPWPAGASSATLRIGAELSDPHALTPVAVRVGNGSVGQLALVPEDLTGAVASRGAPLVVEVRVKPTEASPRPPRGRPRPPRR